MVGKFSGHIIKIDIKRNLKYNELISEVSSKLLTIRLYQDYAEA